MYFVVPIEILNLMRWMMCAATGLVSALPIRDCNPHHAGSKNSTNSMMPSSISGSLRRWGVACAAGLFLMLALHVAPLDRGPLSSRDSFCRDGCPKLPAAGAAAISESRNRSEVRNYFMDFAGDHSLDVATVIEQPTPGYTKYTVQLHLTSGAEQSVIVRAPPGGLQVEMHDMTGDKIANDVVLRPLLAQWPSTVLVSDGNNHFKVVSSETDPASLSSSEDLGSRRPDSQTFVLLMSSGFKAIHLPNSRRLFPPQLQECLLYIITQTITDRLGHASSPGRAPPLVTPI